MCFLLREKLAALLWIVPDLLDKGQYFTRSLSANVKLAMFLKICCCWQRFDLLVESFMKC